MVAPAQLLRHLGRAPELIVARRHTPAFGSLVARYLQLGSPRYPFQIPLRNGGSLTLASHTEVTVFWQIFVHGSYVLPERCETILDAGANVGIFSVWAAIERPRVNIIAVEPSPDTFAALTAHVRGNGLEHRIQCAQLALAAKSGERLIQTTGDSPVRRMVVDQQPTAETVSVRCASLEECLQMHQLERLDLLKMDIEGSEWEVLFGADVSVLRRIRHIQLEYHEINARFGYTPEHLFSYLKAAGHDLIFRTEDRCHTGLAYFRRPSRI